MKISAKGIYALEIMLDILEYGEAAPVVIKEAAARRDISSKYAEQVVSTLNFAGLVKSVRGPKGGYRASNKAKTTTVGTVLRLTEGVLKEHGQSIEDIGLNAVLEDLNSAIDKILDKYTLFELLEMRRDAGNDYVI